MSGLSAHTGSPRSRSCNDTFSGGCFVDRAGMAG